MTQINRLWLDLETRSTVPLRQGVAKYARAATVLILSWADGDGEIHVEDLTKQPYPSDAFYDALQMADEIWAHNAQFDRTVLDHQSWWPASSIPVTQWRCTAALARMHGLPGGLDKLCEIFKIDANQAKLKDGHALIKAFCIPQHDGRFGHPKGALWQKFIDYARQDIAAMRAIWKAMPRWNTTPRMWAAWHLDQTMNKRGVRFDTLLAKNAVELTKRAKRELAARTTEITEDKVDSTTQGKRLLAYLADHEGELPDLKADTVERRLADDDLPEAIKELLRIRQQASKSSTAKYQRVLDLNIDERIHDMVQFCGAARTGRFAGKTIQPHNFPRPKHKPAEIEEAIARFHKLDYDGLELMQDGVMNMGASCLRGLIIAAEDRKLVVADLANIEGRIMAWIAGEGWKLDAFRAYDAKKGPDLYKVSYARPFNIDPESIADEGDMRRQIGKVMELALQYYGGVGAFCNMAETYGLDLDELAASAAAVIPSAYIAKANRAWDRAVIGKRTYELKKPVYVVCSALVQMWRDAHPGVVGFWADLDHAVSMACKNPGKQYPVGNFIRVDKKDAWLRIKLPSGRYLSYPSPRLNYDTGTIRDFLGVNPYSHQWSRVSTYSGKLTENIVQGIAADILIDGLLASEKEGFNPILSVHDEIVCEPPQDWSYCNDAKLSRVMCESSPWTAGMPLAAKGFQGKRYRK